MHIVMISDTETQGGAAIAASRLAQGLAEAGHKVTRVVAYPDGQKHIWHTVVLTPPFAFGRRLIRRMLPLGARHIWNKRSMSHIQSRLGQLLKVLSPDLINLHNLHGATVLGWFPSLLPYCVAYAPTIWTLHDMWSFTGRCVYSYDCRRFLTGCDEACPTPMEYPALLPEQVSGEWLLRQSVYGESPLAVAITPSQWLAQQARAGLWAEHRIEVIPNCVPLHLYQLIDRTQARQQLGIQGHGPVLLIAAANLGDRRKGSAFLLEALQTISYRPLTLVTLGSGDVKLQAEGVNLRSLGYVKNEQTRVLAYNAADLFIHPAPVDNLPNVVIESIACGTPVVGFPVGGVPEMVRPEQTGWLASEVTVGGLTRAIETALDELSTGVNLRESCRAVAEAEYSVDIQVQRYLSLYRELSFQY